jgi:hypothetical protein
VVFLRVVGRLGAAGRFAAGLEGRVGRAHPLSVLSGAHRGPPALRPAPAEPPPAARSPRRTGRRARGRRFTVGSIRAATRSGWPDFRTRPGGGSR